MAIKPVPQELAERMVAARQGKLSDEERDKLMEDMAEYEEGIED